MKKKGALLSDSDDDFCLGFKEGKAVMKNMSEKAPEKPPLKKTVLVRVDPNSGDKYIDVNGKKIKIVPQKLLGISTNLSKLVTDAKTNVNKSPNVNKASLRVYQPPTRDNTLKIIVNKNGEISKPDKIIKAVPTQILGPVVSTGSKKAMDEVLNLSKMCDKGVQTDNAVVKHSCCQTDNENDSLEFASEFSDYFTKYMNDDELPPFILNETVNNVNMGNGPVMPVPYTNPASDALLAKKKFFEDLQLALMPNADGNLPIHEAVIKDNMAAVKRNITVLRARNEHINLENHDHHTPLQLAILHYTQLDIVKLLLDNGADILDCDDEGNNLLHLAVQYNRTDSLEAMLKFAHKHKICIDEFNFEGQTPLIIACLNSLFECAQLLIKFECDVNLRDKKSGRTALFHASEKHDIKMVQLLLDNRADPKVKNFFGTSPHDAMYEIDEIPQVIKSMIFKKNKRKINELLEQVNKEQNAEAPPKKTLKTYPKLKKIDQNEITFIKSRMAQPVK